MRNSRGQVFALFLVFITLFLCGVVAMLYMKEQGNVNSSLVSPSAILEMRDDLEIFEIREKALIEYLVEDIEGDFGSDEFIEVFRERFLDEMIGNARMMEFIYGGLVFGGRDYEDEAMGLGRDFLDVNLYSDVVNRDGKLVFSRNLMGKKVSLRAIGGKEKIKFPVEFVYEFEKVYTITKNEEAL
jgi:hypothetical protein